MTGVRLPEPGEVHVWRVALDPPPRALDGYRPALSADERARAGRFRTEVLRRRFVAGRGALRAILAGYLGVAPTEVAFAYGGHGKPRLDPNGPGVEFNLAHSDDLAVCAVALGRAVGVDVERVRPVDGSPRIVARYFTPGEHAEFLGHPEPERPGAFFRGWTRKESFLKVTGAGLSAGLDSFEVSLGAAGAVLRRVGDDPEAARRWSLRDVDAGPGFASAVAVEGPLTRISLLDWPVGRPPARPGAAVEGLRPAVTVAVDPPYLV
jgi:4'-phosphopantetheinyl transferase